MRKPFILICLMAMNFYSFAQNNPFYYYKGEKIPLNVNQKHFVVYFEKQEISAQEIAENYNVVSTILPSFDSLYLFCELKVDMKNIGECMMFLRNQRGVRDIEYVVGEGNDEIWVSNMIYIQLINRGDTNLLKNYADTICTLNLSVSDSELFDNWYAVKCENIDLTSIEVGNIFYESDLFRKVDYGFMINYKSNTQNCVSDLEFNSQWNMDAINACNAWQITCGDTNIRVAIVDDGLDESHNEFSNTNISFSYDADAGYSIVYPGLLTSSHGTHVGGIIFAGHNDYTVAGVAPNSSLINIKRTWSTSDANSNMHLARGMNKAIQKGARIMNNSWGDYNGNVSLLHGVAVEAALDYAIDNGVLVVCSSGNMGVSGVDFPASYSDKFLAVGAVSEDNTRSSFSSYGTELDVVAPGNSIYSTYNGSSYYTLSGTSQAAPHVSGIAALVMSANPSLSSEQVARIIKGTAQKVGGYNYQYSNSHLNGSWHQEMGHGLVDAAAAVSVATAFTKDFYIKDYSDDTGSEPNITSSNIKQSTDIWLTDLYGNTVSSPEKGGQYYVNIRIRNNRQTFSEFNYKDVKVYWTTKSGNLFWPNFLNPTYDACNFKRSGVIESSSTSSTWIGPNSSTIVTIYLNIPSYQSMTCVYGPGMKLSLVALVEDGGLTIGENDNNVPLEHFIRANNNVACKSYSLIDPTLPPIGPIILSPNPATNQVNVEFQLQDGISGATLLLTNMMGVTVYSTQLSNGETSHNINLQNIPPGRYLVHIVKSTGHSSSKQLIIE